MTVMFAGLTTVRPAAAPPGSQTITYGEDIGNFPNPERGFYHRWDPMWTGTQRRPINSVTVGNYRAEGITMVRAMYVIDEFRDSPLSADALAAITADLAAIRQAGAKIIPRFAYNFATSVNDGPDAPLERVLEHITQLTPILQANADVIAFMQMGFVGPWGEWHHSTNQLVNSADFTLNDSSRAIVAAILSALPVTRNATIRYPFAKQQLYGLAPLTAVEAFSGAPKSRVGAHNDCFLADASDRSTYSGLNYVPQVEFMKTYLSEDNRFVPQEGETCADDAAAQPYIQCSNSLVDLARMRWSSLDVEFKEGVIALWQSQGCFGEIQRRLGYRLRLISALVPTEVRERHALTGQLTITNSGFAAPYNRRDVELILRHSVTGALHRLPVIAEPRFWGGGETHTLEFNIDLPPEVTAGSYELLVNLSDPEASLRTRAEYSIRLANAGTWEPTTGFNKLLASVTVTPPQPFTDPQLTSGLSTIRAVHLTELRARVDALRADASLSSMLWTDPDLLFANVRAVHISELRQALAAVYAARKLMPPIYSDPDLLPGSFIAATHIVELRNAVIAVE